jgi:hypothetical protein
MTTAGGHPFTYREAEAIVADLLVEGYAARSYKHRPAGYEVRVTGRRGGGVFHYTILTTADLADFHRGVPQGRTGEDKQYREGE